MKSFWIVGLAFALALVLSACGGGDKKETPVLDDAALKEMVMITSEGLPWEITSLGDAARSNEESASQYPDSEQWLKDYEEWGRTGGHYAEFQVGDSAAPSLGLQTEVEGYSSADGAGSAWSAVREFILSEDMQDTLKDAGVTEAAIEEVSAEKVGEESVALRMAVDSQGVTGESFVILFRRGGILALAIVGGGEGSATVADAVAVAKQLDTRIQDVLKR
jgi:hypothetical protein